MTKKPRSKPIQNVLVPYEDFSLAQARWLQFTKSVFPTEFSIKIIGRAVPLFTSTLDLYLPIEAARKIKLLIGPHYHTVLKAWEAQEDGN